MYLIRDASFELSESPIHLPRPNGIIVVHAWVACIPFAFDEAHPVVLHTYFMHYVTAIVALEVLSRPSHTALTERANVYGLVIPNLIPLQFGD